MKAEPLEKGLSRFRNQSGTACLLFDISQKQSPRHHDLRPRGGLRFFFFPQTVFPDQTLVQHQGTIKSVHTPLAAWIQLCVSCKDGSLTRGGVHRSNWPKKEALDMYNISEFPSVRWYSPSLVTMVANIYISLVLSIFSINKS